MKQINNILSQFSTLSSEDKRNLLNKLKVELSESKIILDHKKTPKNCPHCGHDKIWKHGLYKDGGKRFQCQKVECKKTFNELSGTSIHGIKKKHLWDRFIDMMLDSKTIRETSLELKLSTKTVFDWRHKVLSSLNNLFTKEFKGIVETDDVYFRFDQKGRKKNNPLYIKKSKKKRGISSDQISVMVTMDRYKTMDFKVVKIGKLCKKGMERVINKDRFNTHNIICSDKNQSIINFYSEMKLTHKTFIVSKGEYVKDGIYHVNTLNNTVGRLVKWVSGNFISVSTKYLQNYLNWFLIIEILKNEKDELKSNQFWNYLLGDSTTFERFHEIENSYVEFLNN